MEKLEPKPVTAQLPDGATTFDTLVPVHTDKKGITTGHRSLPGCYRTPKRPPAE